MPKVVGISRIARNPIPLPEKVDVTLEDQSVTVKGVKGELSLSLHQLVQLKHEEGGVRVEATATSQAAKAMVGTFAALVKNMVHGVSQGFTKKLLLVGVGYRVQLQGTTLNLSLGLSHPVSFAPPEGIRFEAPSQTEILIHGVDKQVVGEIAAKIRALRPPEPYKGKGIRYADETIILKETKKK